MSHTANISSIRAITHNHNIFHTQKTRNFIHNNYTHCKQIYASLIPPEIVANLTQHEFTDVGEMTTAALLFIVIITAYRELLQKQ